tara:strand:+ start:328 stop:483 length:156 start_codon:yes stop_codon:yes gene_type:complete
MSIWEEHRDEYYLEQAMKKAEHNLHHVINASFKKVLAKELLKKKDEDTKEL